MTHSPPLRVLPPNGATCSRECAWEKGMLVAFPGVRTAFRPGNASCLGVRATRAAGKGTRWVARAAAAEGREWRRWGMRRGGPSAGIRAVGNESRRKDSIARWTARSGSLTTDAKPTSRRSRQSAGRLRRMLRRTRSVSGSALHYGECGHKDAARSRERRLHEEEHPQEDDPLPGDAPQVGDGAGRRTDLDHHHRAAAGHHGYRAHLLHLTGLAVRGQEVSAPRMGSFPKTF